jgi:hypothetical protein
VTNWFLLDIVMKSTHMSKNNYAPPTIFEYALSFGVYDEYHKFESLASKPAKYKPECLELWSKAFRSFLVIISMVGLLAVMVNRKSSSSASGSKITCWSTLQ